VGARALIRSNLCVRECDYWFCYHSDSAILDTMQYILFTVGKLNKVQMCFIYDTLSSYRLVMQFE
jgi:hypothetical protein